FEFSFSASILATVLTSYHAYNYDLTLLLLPVSIICGKLATQRRLLSSKVFIASLVVLFLPPVHFFLVTHGIYALMCIPILMLFVIVVQSLRHGYGEQTVA